MVDRSDAVDSGGSAGSESIEPFDLDAFSCRIKKLSEIHRKLNSSSETLSSDSEELLKQWVDEVESRTKESEPEFLDMGLLGFKNLDVYLEHTNKELNAALFENTKISDEIEVLKRTSIEDSIELEIDLEELNDLLKSVDSQDLYKLQTGVLTGESQGSPINAQLHKTLESLELNYRIEKGKSTLSFLQELDSELKRVEATGHIEDILSCVRVIEFEGNCIRLSLKTVIPTSEGLFWQKKMDYVTEPSVLDHELLIEVMAETLKLQNVEIFPNDVFIGEIIDHAKSLRLFYWPLSLPEIGSSLEHLVRKVQLRILLCTLRRLLVKDANQSRHSFAYSDRDETITAHLVGEIDAFIKISQSWPLSSAPLKLISLKNSHSHSKGISLSFLCKIEELANSLDIQIRCDLSSFVDAIEEILVQQQQSQLHSNNIQV